MTRTNREHPTSEASFEQDVVSHFGLLPNFFCTAENAPGLIRELWSFAKAAYLDNPLPAGFKERLFVHLSRFCEVRYCVIRHVGFLLGHGNTVGDASVPPHSIEKVVALLSHPIPDPSELEGIVLRLESSRRGELPAQDTQLEADLFVTIGQQVTTMIAAGNHHPTVEVKRDWYF